MQTNEPHIVTPENAARIWSWLQERGGIIVWQSHDLGNPSASVTTPAQNKDGTPMGSPGWRYPEPTRLITDPTEVVVVKTELLEEMPITVKPKGFRLVVTKGSERKCNARLKKLKFQHPRKNVWWTPSGDFMFPSVFFYIDTEEIPIEEYIKTQQCQPT